MILKDILKTVSYHQDVEIIWGDRSLSGQYDDIKLSIPVELLGGVVKDIAAYQDCLKIWLNID